MIQQFLKLMTALVLVQNIGIVQNSGKDLFLPAQQLTIAGTLNYTIDAFPAINVIELTICWLSSNPNDRIYFMVPAVLKDDDLTKVSIGNSDLYCATITYPLSHYGSRKHNGIEYGFFNANLDRNTSIGYDLSYRC